MDDPLTIFILELHTHNNMSLIMICIVLIC